MGIQKIHYFLANIVILSSLVIVIYKLFDNQKQSMIAQTNHKLLQNEIEFQKKNLNTHIPQVIVQIRNDSFNFPGIYV